MVRRSLLALITALAVVAAVPAGAQQVIEVLSTPAADLGAVKVGGTVSLVFVFNITSSVNLLNVYLNSTIPSILSFIDASLTLPNGSIVVLNATVANGVLEINQTVSMDGQGVVEVEVRFNASSPGVGNLSWYYNVTAYLVVPAPQGAPSLVELESKSGSGFSTVAVLAPIVGGTLELPADPQPENQGSGTDGVAVLAAVLVAAAAFILVLSRRR